MKINEITEGFLDSLKKVIGDKSKELDPNKPLGARVARAESQPQFRQLGQIAAKAWLKTLASLEQRNQGPLNPGQYKTQLTQFIDRTLMGNIELAGISRMDPDAGRMVDAAINRLSQSTARNDADAWRDNFTRLSAVAGTLVAGGVADYNKPDSTQPTQAPQSTDTRPFTVTGSLDKGIAKTGNFELRLDDPDQRAIYDRVRQEFLKGDLKA